eukprot:COSAG02_NODE_297_length_25355_cov_78.632998_17_plen_281_part_00
MAETAALAAVAPAAGEQAEVQAIKTDNGAGECGRKRVLILISGVAAAILIGGIVGVIMVTPEDETTSETPCPPPVLKCGDYTSCSTYTYVAASDDDTVCPQAPNPWTGDTCDPGNCNAATCCSTIISGMCAGNTHDSAGVLLTSSVGVDYVCPSGYTMKTDASSRAGWSDTLCCDQCPPPVLKCGDYTSCSTYTYVAASDDNTVCPQAPNPWTGDTCDPGNCNAATCCSAIISGMCAGNTHDSAGVLLTSSVGVDYVCSSGTLKASAGTLYGWDDATCCN